MSDPLLYVRNELNKNEPEEEIQTNPIFIDYTHEEIDNKIMIYNPQYLEEYIS